MCGSSSGAVFPKSWRTRSSNTHVRDDPRNTTAYHGAMSILESWNGKAGAPGRKASPPRPMLFVPKPRLQVGAFFSPHRPSFSYERRACCFGYRRAGCDRREQVRRKRMPMRWCRSRKPAKSTASIKASRGTRKAAPTPTLDNDSIHKELAGSFFCFLLCFS
jgi:hypothetical protein